MPALDLVTIGPQPHAALLAALTGRLSGAFRVRVSLVPAPFAPEQAYDAARGQYGSTRLLALLLEARAGADRVLGVTDGDLFIPVLSYVFGEAQLGGRAAVVSSHRLDPRRYGLPADPSRLLDRLGKEAVHELGHTYGLIHCRAPQCVMHASTYVEEIDLKTGRFCPQCRDRIAGEAASDRRRIAPMTLS